MQNNLKWTALGLAFTALSAAGQVGEVEVSVTDKYRAKVAEAVKISGQPSLSDTSIQKLPVSITVRPSVVAVEPVMELIPPVKISKTKLERLPSRYVSLIAGNYGSVEAEAAIGSVRSVAHNWSVRGTHRSTRGGFAKDYVVFDRLLWSESTLDGTYERIFNRGRLRFEGGGAWDRIPFYGQSWTVNPADTANAAPGRGIQTYTAGARYQATRYRRTQMFRSASVSGHHWIDQGGRQFESGAQARIESALPVQNLVLNLPLSFSINQLQGSARPDTSSTAWAAQFSPSLADSIKGVRFRFGLNVIATGGPGQKTLPYFPPVVHVEVPLVRDVLYLYGGMDGQVDNGGMRARVDAVPFLSESATYEAIRSSSIYGGATGRWSRIVGYRFGGRYTTWDNYPMVVRPQVDFGIPDDSGRVGMQYVKATVLEPTGELTFQFKQVWDVRLYGLLRFALQDQDQKPVYHLPKYEFGAQARANFGDKIRLDGAMVLRGARTTLDGLMMEYDLPAFMDVRVGAQYRYNSQLDAVVRIDNLLNQRAEWWMGYPIQGIRANLGLVYKF
ncbi:MAG: hypothetical protein ACO30N_00120 [Schleiferiaceae bacterium]